MTTSQIILKPGRERRKSSSVSGHEHFAMVEMHAIENLAALIRTAPKAAELMVLLMRQLRSHSGGVVVASRQALAELLGVTARTVDRALSELISGGWVQRVRISGAHAIAINSRVAWVGPRGEIPHAVFSATVIASRSEQDELALNPPPAQKIPLAFEGETAIIFGDGLPPPSQPCIEGLEPVIEQEAVAL